MSTLEATCSMLERMKEEEIEEQLVKSVAKSDEGHTKSSKEVMAKMRDKYAI